MQTSLISCGANLHDLRKDRQAELRGGQRRCRLPPPLRPQTQDRG
jgi:hypothetical protein